MRRPVIGISGPLEIARRDGHQQRAHLVPRAYVDAVQRAGGVALVLAVDGDGDPGDLVGLVDGLLLAGGTDIDPAVYGAPRHPLTSGVAPERDAFEVALLRAALASDLPVTGICRGMQLINVALGGTLLQDIPEAHGHDDHRRTPGSFADADHDVRVAPGSLAERVIGDRTHLIKSHHHQAVDRVGAGLVVSAWSERDDLPEAIELPARRYVLGVQWHPEVDPASPVVPALVEAARDGLGERDT